MVLPRLDGEELALELEGIDLGDSRLNVRAVEVLRALAESPSSSFAQACDTEAEREGMYRFLRNDRVHWQGLIAPHIEATTKRAASCSSLLAIHDTTTVRLPDDADVESFINTGKKGFLAHITLITDGSRDRFPLGAAGMEIIERSKKGRSKTSKGRALSGGETSKLKNKEFDRWERQISNVQDVLKHPNVTHVIDREADCFALLAYLVEQNLQFVVRFCKNRKARAVRAGSEWALVRDVLKDAKTFKRLREVPVSKRKEKTAPDYNKSHPARVNRSAQLHISYAPMLLGAPKYNSGENKELRVSAVCAKESTAPDGVKPIEWILLTNLEVSTKADAERIIDIYRQRWLIEEFFKALKTGCRYSKRHLTNRNSIYNTLAAFLPIAWRALLLRQLAKDPNASINDTFSTVELKFLRIYAAHIKERLPTPLTPKDILNFIASCGGHRKHRGDPGWQTIMKGLERFQLRLEGWMLATSEM